MCVSVVLTSWKKRMMAVDGKDGKQAEREPGDAALDISRAFLEPLRSSVVFTPKASF
jgi:hypothetical protein